MANESVLGDADLVAAILAQADIDPWTFVMCGRVARAWRAACRSDASLVLKAARGRPFLTKGVFCGLFGLSFAEADTFPRDIRAHKMGLMYMYSGPAVDAVMGAIGGLSGWETRLAAQAARQAAFDARGRKAWVALDRKRARPWEGGHTPRVRLCV